MNVLFQLGELSEAEDALSEANILNNTDSEVWAYLSLVCLKTGRQVEAEQAYKYAVKVFMCNTMSLFANIVNEVSSALRSIACIAELLYFIAVEFTR